MSQVNAELIPAAAVVIGVVIGQAGPVVTTIMNRRSERAKNDEDRARTAYTAFVEAAIRFAAWTEPASESAKDFTRREHLLRVEAGLHQKLLELMSASAPVMIAGPAQARTFATAVLDAAGELLPVMVREVAGPGGEMPASDREIVDKYIGARDAFVIMAGSQLSKT